MHGTSVTCCRQALNQNCETFQESRGGFPEIGGGWRLEIETTVRSGLEAGYDVIQLKIFKDRLSLKDLWVTASKIFKSLALVLGRSLH